MKVSVIIAAYCSDQTIEMCLLSLRGQSWRDFEIIVVNSSNEKRTGAIVTERFPEVIFIQHPSRLLPQAARNLGVDRASGELLVFADPDCQQDSEWLAHLIAAYRAGHEFVCGSMDIQQNCWSEISINLCKFHWVLPNQPARTSWIAATANACCSRRLWQQIGPFPGEIFCGDALFSWRGAAVGQPVWFEPRAIVKHHHGHSILKLWGERYRRGREFAQVRAGFEHWSRLRALSYLLLTPLLLLLVGYRMAQDAARSGWLMRFLATLPFHQFGQLGWILGESRSYAQVVFQGIRPIQ